MQGGNIVGFVKAEGAQESQSPIWNAMMSLYRVCEMGINDSGIWAAKIGKTFMLKYVKLTPR